MFYPPSLPVQSLHVAQGSILRPARQYPAAGGSLQICIAYAVTISSNHDFQPVLGGRTSLNTGTIATAFHVPGRPPLGPWLQVIVSKQESLATPDSVVGVSPSQFDIAEKSLIPQPERLDSFSVSTTQLEQRSAAQGPFKDYRDFLDRGLTKAPAVVRRYSVTGHQVKIIITDRFAQAIESAQAGSRAAQSDRDDSHVALKNRVSPADLPGILDLLPDSRYFSQILLSNEPNPEDDWVTQTYMQGKAPFVSSMAALHDEVMLFKQDRNEYLCRDVLHEWAHTLRDKYYEDPLAWGFGYSVDLEGTEWLARSYMARSKGDQWAVLGERLLGQDGKDFLEACEKAPLRTTFFMQALEKCLQNVDREHRSIYHERYMERVRFAKEHVLPNAVARLRRAIFEGTDSQRDTARMIWKYLIAEGMIDQNMSAGMLAPVMMQGVALNQSGRV